MNEELIIYAVSAVVIFFGLYCECTLSTIFYIGAIRLCIFMLKATNSIIRNFFQVSLNLEERYGSGSWVLVTGAANGIGLEYCKQFALRNFNLIMIDKDEQGLENAKEIIKHYHSNIKINAISCDLSSLKSVESNNNFLKNLMDLDISILVNNAGIGDAIPFNELSRDKIQSIIQINMIIPVIFTSFLYNTLSQRSHSGVINMASVAGILPNPSSMIYSMTKGFLRYFSNGIYEESKGKVDILTVCPGYVSTPMIMNLSGYLIIDTKTCVNGVLKALGQQTETNTNWIHELIYCGITQRVFYFFQMFEISKIAI